MPLQLLPVTSTDLPRLAQIHAKAFYLIPVMQSVWTKGVTPTIISELESRHRSFFESDPTVRYWKVVDPEQSNSIIAFAEWHVFNTPEEEASRLDLGPKVFGPEIDKELMREYSTYIVEARMGMQGNAHCCRFNHASVLRIVATDPSQHRRGAGALLVDWGVREADSKNLPCFLESSPHGAGLYRKFGFEQVGELSVDIGKKKGVKEMYTHLVMIRPSKKG